MAVKNRLQEVIWEWSVKHGARLTIEALAEATGIGAAALYKIVNRRTEGIKFDQLDRLCEALEVEPQEILVRVPNETPLTKPLNSAQASAVGPGDSQG